jgi:RHS repeat-associated protein
MAEYDHDGNCVKDYIYAGNRLIAEYQPQANKYYYYMSDQINSTRIVTDDNGNVVYSESYGPFGGVQKNWTKSYDPKLKFSGKEREAYGDLDYFGARYFDHDSYRFISVDPIINKVEALSNPQLWNLYAYCKNNPITYLDPDGRIFKESSKEEIYQKVPVIKQIDDAIEKFNQTRQFCMEITLSIAMGFFMGPMDFAAPKSSGTPRSSTNPKGPGKISKFFKGKGFPEKMNRGGKLQPFNPKNGRFLPYSANPGLSHSPFSNIVSGLSQGFTSGLSGAPMPVAGTQLQSLGQSIGQIVGNIVSMILMK